MASRFYSAVLFFSVVSLAMAMASAKAPASSSKPAQQVIRVRTHHNKSVITVSGFGVRINGHKVADSNLPAKSKFTVRNQGRVWRIELSRPYIADSDELVISGDMLRVENAPVADKIVLNREKRLRFDVISELAIEDYLKGVIPSEMPARWPVEALKAQVVASRSYALNEIQAHEGEKFHLDDSILHQVFNWSKYLGASAIDQDRINKAIAETRDDLLVDQSGAPFKAFFHSDCGGHTEEPSAVWGRSEKQGEEKFGTVKDAHCALNLKSQWREEISREEFEQILSKYFGLDGAAAVQSLTVKSHSTTGRVQNLLVAFNDAAGATSAFTISAQSLRQLFGFTRIKSTNFNFEMKSSEIVFSGRGNGHGVGLCQQGAKFMATAGADYRAILKRYYPSAKISNL